MKQYPHYLFKAIPGAQKDETTGRYTSGEDTVEFVGMCREEKNGGRTINAGGEQHVYDSMVYLPKGSPSIEVGTTVMVCDDDGHQSVRVKAQCSRYDAGRLHNRMWL